MAIKISISNKVTFKVKGETATEDGKSEPFEFTLTARRLDDDEANTTQAELLAAIGKTGNHAAITELLCGGSDNDPATALVTNWLGVKDEDNAQLAYTPALLRQLLKARRGLNALIWRTYQNETGSKEKN